MAKNKKIEKKYQSGNQSSPIDFHLQSEVFERTISNYGFFKNTLINEVKIYPIENERLNDFKNLIFLKFAIKLDKTECCESSLTFEQIIGQNKNDESFTFDIKNIVKEKTVAQVQKIIPKGVTFEKAHTDPMLENMEIAYKGINPGAEYEQSDFLSSFVSVKLWYLSLGTKVGYGWFWVKDNPKKFIVKKVEKVTHGVKWVDADGDSFYCYAFLREEFPEFSITGLCQYVVEHSTYDYFGKYFDIAIEKTRIKWAAEGYNPLLKKPMSLRKTQDTDGLVIRKMDYVSKSGDVVSNLYSIEKEKNLNFSILEWLLKNDYIQLEHWNNLFSDNFRIIDTEWNKILNFVKERGLDKYVHFQETQELGLTSLFLQNQRVFNVGNLKLSCKIIEEKNNYCLVEIEGKRVYIPSKSIMDIESILYLNIKNGMPIDYEELLYDGRNDVFSVDKIKEFIASDTFKLFESRAKKRVEVFNSIVYDRVDGNRTQVSLVIRFEKLSVYSIRTFKNSDIEKLLSCFCFLQYINIDGFNRKDNPFLDYLESFQYLKDIKNYENEGSEELIHNMIGSNIQNFSLVPQELIEKEKQKFMDKTSKKEHVIREVTKHEWETFGEEQEETKPIQWIDLTETKSEESNLANNNIVFANNFNLDTIARVPVFTDDAEKFTAMVGDNFFDMSVVEVDGNEPFKTVFELSRITKKSGNILLIANMSKEFIAIQEAFKKRLGMCMEIKDELILSSLNKNYIVYWCHSGLNMLSNYHFSQTGNNIQVDKEWAEPMLPLYLLKNVVKSLLDMSESVFLGELKSPALLALFEDFNVVHISYCLDENLLNKYIEGANQIYIIKTNKKNQTLMF